MTRIELSPEVVTRDIERFFAFFAHHAIENAADRVEELIVGLDVLAHSPLIGRPTRDGARELVVGTRGRGYVALCRHVPAIDTVFVLAIRHQREAGD